MLSASWVVCAAPKIQVAAGALPDNNVALSAAVSERCTDLTAQLIRDDGFADKSPTAMVRQIWARRAR